MDRNTLAEMLENARRGQPFSGAKLVEVLEAFIETQDKLNRVVTCR